MYAYHINVWEISFSLSLKYKQLDQFSAFTNVLVEFQYNEQFVLYYGIRHTIVQPIYYTHTCRIDHTDFVYACMI